MTPTRSKQIFLAGHVDDPDKPTIMGDATYAGADTLDDLTEAGYDVNTKVPPAGRVATDDSARTTSTSTLTPAPLPARPIGS